MAKNDYSTWLTKQAAAEAIGVSQKTVEQWTQAKRLQSAYIKRAQTGARIVVYHPDDVERLRKERNPDAEPFVVPESVNGSTALVHAPAPGTAEQFLTTLRTLEKHSEATLRTLEKHSEVRVTERLALTIPEASDYSNLPQTHLRRLIKAGDLKASKISGRWLIARKRLAEHVEAKL